MRRVARSALVDGFVLMDVELHDERVGVLRELGLIGVPSDTDDVTCVDLDFDTAAAMCVEHRAAELGLSASHHTCDGSPEPGDAMIVMAR
jgi:LacI family transcriptional regulator, galactose operon repressor